MMTNAKMQKTISLILIAGTALAAILIIIGGTMLLWQHGNMPFKTAMLTESSHHVSFHAMRRQLHDETSIAFLEFGLLCLVMTQLIRVALLSWFYAVTRDIAYTLISLFILCVLIYSTLLQ